MVTYYVAADGMDTPLTHPERWSLLMMFIYLDYLHVMDSAHCFSDFDLLNLLNEHNYNHFCSGTHAYHRHNFHKHCIDEISGTAAFSPLDQWKQIQCTADVFTEIVCTNSLWY